MFDSVTLGIEEEFQIVDLTRVAAFTCFRVLEKENDSRRADQARDDPVDGGSRHGICKNIQEARADITLCAA